MSSMPSNNPCAPHGDGRIFHSLFERHLRVPVIEVPNEVPSSVKVSICVPTYQHIATIGKCLDSLLDQDVDFAYEILLGEDGSRDGTRELCREYANKYPEKIRLFLHSRENNIKINGQPSGRFNFLYLLSKANGEFIAICEGDDWWTDKNKLGSQVQAMMRFPASNVSCHPANAESLSFAKQGGIIGYHGDRQKVIPAAEIILSGGGFCATLSIMFHRRVVGGLPEWLIDAPVLDYYLLVIASLAGGCLYIPTTSGVYGSAYGADSWTNRLLSNEKFAIDFEESFFEYLDKLSNEVGYLNRGAVEGLRKKRRAESLFSRHLPRWFRAAVYRDIKSTLSAKWRVGWYLSAWGMFPGFVLRTNGLVKSLLSD